LPVPPFSQGNAYLRLRDHLGTIFTDTQFAPLSAHRGQPAECPWRLALVTLLQFAENLSDRRAADAVRSRIDWKYLLGLELTDHGFDASVPSRVPRPSRGRRRGRATARHPSGTLP
jgi:transposase